MEVDKLTNERINRQTATEVDRLIDRQTAETDREVDRLGD